MSETGMWQSAGFAFLMERGTSRVRVDGLVYEKISDNFISFMALMQKLRVEILPITWQSARREIGWGGTSKVNEALATIQMSFAFKRIADNEMARGAGKEQFRALSNEIMMLSQDCIREHPNIVRLQGICWDIPSEDIVWPVLVFEKAKLGDLYNFVRSGPGGSLDVQGRLKICCEIGRATTHMHSQNIIHGDIKPQNILIFRNDGGEYTAKVTDFGYSTRYADEKHLISVPISDVWTAPEHVRPNQRWRPSEAKKMDIYSLGLLSFWLLFERNLSKSSIVIEKLESGVISNDFADTSLAALKLLKMEAHLPSLVGEFLDAESSLSEKTKNSLLTFFNSVLGNGPQERDLNAWEIFSEAPAKANNHHPQLSEGEEIKFWSEDFSFQIKNSISELYASDYRIRSHIFRCLEALPPSDADHDTAAFQKAICYRIGFGIKGDYQKSNEMLQKTGYTETELQRALDDLLTTQKTSYRAPEVQELRRLGHMPVMEFDNYYLEHGELQDAETRLSQEVEDLEKCLGEDNDITSTVKQTLCSIFFLQEQWDRAQTLQAELIYASMRRGASPTESSLLTAINNLATMFSKLGDLQNAEKLQLLLVRKSDEALGAAHLTSITNMNNIAVTYCHLGRFEEAANLGDQALRISLDLLGPEHPLTLVSMAELALIYRKQWRWADVEALQIQVLETNQTVLGPDNPITLTAKMNLAGSFYILKRYAEAESLATAAAEGQRRILGETHPNTLSSMEIVADLYQKLDRREEAIRLTEETAMIREDVALKKMGAIRLQSS